MAGLTRKTAVLIFTFSLLAACGGGGGSSGPAPVDTADRRIYNYTKPADNGDGWATAELADEGFDTDEIYALMDLVLNQDFPNIDSIAIVRNNRLILYWWEQRELTQFDNWVRNTDRERHILHSTSKTFTSALVGIAIDKGHIASTQVPFYDLFNYASYDNWDPRKADMTLEDALTMRLGLEWDEWALPYSDPNNQLAQLNNGNTDWAKALLDLPMNTDPGTSYVYNTAATNAIGQAVQNAVGMPLADFANANLFYPMQITEAIWARTPTNLPIGGSGLYLTNRELVKFGQLYLDNGVWQGQQLISEAYVADSVVPRVDISSWATYSEAYGFQWWLDELTYRGMAVEAWVTSGYGGQYTFVVPSLDLVVGFTGHNYDNNQGIANLYTIMHNYILPAID